MAEILLSSEQFVKSVTSISDNIAGKYLLPSLREAQEMGLREILGDCLLDYLKEIVADGTIEQDDKLVYKTLVRMAQYYLAYQTVVEVTNKVSYKIGNFGVAKSTDENLQVATQDEIGKMQYYYQSKADAHCYQLQTWLLENKAYIPQLTVCACSRITANLKSAATCGVWLGGPRGKQLPGNDCKCSKR